MPNKDDVLWLKSQFQPAIELGISGTPLTVDFMVALACQETGEVWPTLRRKGLSRDEVLVLCVGDTLDADRGRSAFPTTKSDLVAAPNGQQMFDIARQGLVSMAAHIPAYAPAAAKPNKFCHGFGMFQRDLQFFKSNPGYYLNKKYERFDSTLAEALKELNRALKKLGLDSRASLTDLELCAVGITYNTGGYKPAKGLKQGHFDGTKFYGETLFDFLRLAQTVAFSGALPVVSPVAAGEAAVRPPTPVTTAGTVMRVRVTEGMLRVRSDSAISEPAQANVVGHLPDGHVVQVLSNTAKNGFVEIETSLLGALLHGYTSKKFLEAIDATVGTRLLATQATKSMTGITAVYAPSRPGVVTRRRGIANALTLNEPNQPGRSGSTAEDLRQELAAIVDWLDTENSAHLRYQPRDGLTFCNIYAHDFCHLAGVYLPRVWWTSKALVELAQGGAVEPKLGATISEVVANELFAWLRDFGPSFGWRSTGTLTKLQMEVDQGAVGVIAARRKESNRPGHISIVVPEIADWSAKRDVSGEVIAPLQSQAGSTNFRFGTGKKDWWRGDHFAEFAFWIHA